mmetsp:Transcript_12878/g.28546  ORF Transcript_12878/g.28546 Transcript_12878/m.28546 type:complete len:343 (+) Transcript_12878:114-1142(+)
MADEVPPLDWDKLSFAYTPTDTMLVAETANGVWPEKGELRPFGNISISPVAGVLNYGQGLFEGLKAQRTESGEVVLFRPEKNAERMQLGAKRLSMSEPSTDLFVESVKAVVNANLRWVPPHGKGSLYIRPCLWGSGPILGVAPAPEYTLCIYVCPVGPYFKGGLSPISLLVAQNNHRAPSGGQGGVKAIGNYAPGIMVSRAAKKEGFAEVIYLDAQEHKYIEEVGAANFFCVKDNVVYTPDISVGTILPGITRLSVIQLAKDLGHEVKEERVSIDFALSADECFCTGTAAVIGPISKISTGEKTSEYCGGEVGPVTRKLYEQLTGLQVKKLDDPHGWVVSVA